MTVPLARSSGRPQGQPPGLRDKLAWLFADYAFATRFQLRGAVGSSDPEIYRSGNARPVVVLPGIYESWQFLRPLMRGLHRAGHPVHALPALGRNHRPIEQSAKIVARYLRENDLCDVLIVAHSKGGLIGKLVMLEEPRRVTSMVAVCSPFSGSSYARLMLVPALRAFAPSSPTTRALQREQVVNQRIVSVFGEFDPHIPEGSDLAGARNVRLSGGGHFRMLGDPRVRDIVLAAARSSRREEE